MRVSVPASTANLGPGFDVLGLALDLRFHLSVGDLGDDDLACEHRHPAAVAYRRGGGRSDRLGWRSRIPPGKGLGFSGAAHAAGALAAVLERDPQEDPRAAALTIATELEGHPDNAAASLYVGLVVASADVALRVPLAVDLEVVLWWPEGRTSTEQSRRKLPAEVSREDAVFNIGRTALLMAALVTGEIAQLGVATEDRLHTAERASPASISVMEIWRRAGALGVWLSGSGPAVAALTRRGAGGSLAYCELPPGRARVLAIDESGAIW